MSKNRFLARAPNRDVDIEGDDSRLVLYSGGMPLIAWKPGGPWPDALLTRIFTRGELDWVRVSFDHWLETGEGLGDCPRCGRPAPIAFGPVLGIALQVVFCDCARGGLLMAHAEALQLELPLEVPEQPDRAGTEHQPDGDPGQNDSKP